MADLSDKWEDNVPGFFEFNDKKISFYVDKTCIYCNVCEEEAPENFIKSDDECHDFVYKQPENEEELNNCYVALEACPVEAIGDDGWSE
jgi:ferredoxin